MEKKYRKGRKGTQGTQRDISRLQIYDTREETTPPTIWVLLRVLRGSSRPSRSKKKGSIARGARVRKERKGIVSDLDFVILKQN